MFLTWTPCYRKTERSCQTSKLAGSTKVLTLKNHGFLKSKQMPQIATYYNGFTHFRERFLNPWVC